MKLVTFMKVVLPVLFVVFTLGIFILTGAILFSGAADTTKERFQLVAADILVPMFEAVLALVAALAGIKAVATVADNAKKLAANPSTADLTPIKLFDW